MAHDITTSRRHPSYRGTEVAPDETTGVTRGHSGGYHAVSTHDAPGPRNLQSIYSSQPREGVLTVNGDDDDDDDDEHQSWWKKKLSTFQSIELENKGSVARDHLALERTFLAWLRTSLAFASIGIAITQLFRLNTSSSEKKHNHAGDNTLRQLGKPLGTAFLAISIFILMLGFRRYFHGQEWLVRGKFPASRGTIALVALLGFAIMFATLILGIVIHPPEDNDEL